MREAAVLTIMLFATGCSQERSPSASARPSPTAEVATSAGPNHAAEAATSEPTTSKPTSRPAQGSGDTFYALLGLTRYDYTPLSADELVERSELIVRGTIVSVADGEKIRRKHAKIYPDTFTLVVKVDVREVLKGPSTNEVHVEFIHGGAVPTEVYAKHIPSGELTFFLSQRKERQSTESHEIVDKGKGHPEGTPLYALTTPQGLVASTDGKQFLPLEPEQSLAVFDIDAKAVAEARSTGSGEAGSGGEAVITSGDATRAGTAGASGDPAAQTSAEMP